MTGDLIEATLELRASSLRDAEGSDVAFVHARAGGGVSGIVLTGFLALSRARPAGCERSGGRSGPPAEQAILGRGRWDADALRDLVRDCALETSDPRTLCWFLMRRAF